MKRDEIFARDEYRCVYCGTIQPVELLSLDHVQAKVRGGDRSPGNLVTACMSCNTLKANHRLADFLASSAVARENFFRYALHVWPRHLRTVREDLDRALKGRF
jgi:5-methylcytosine-specific restriction endonuclease McrA